MQEDKYIAWAMQTSKKWSDIEAIIKNTGIDFVDQDHRTLVKYALNLNKVLDQHDKAYSIELIKETDNLLMDIYKYTKEHFSREEKFMDKYDLPNQEDHKYEHDRILRMLENVLSDFKHGKVNITRHLKLHIMEWLLHHINVVDVDYFKVKNWGNNIDNADNWQDVKEIIKLIGNEMIDHQHEEMTKLALDVIAQLHYKNDIHFIDEQCDRLLKYARYHFSCEAELMEKYQIKDKEKHMKIHDVFLNLINEHREKIKKDPSSILEMKKSIITWWIEHINKTDADYFSFSKWGHTLLEQSNDLEELKVILKKTGIEKIDLDHYELLIKTMKLNELINQKGQDVEDSSESEKVFEILCDMYDYAVEHFHMEEDLMQKMESKDFLLHTNEHREILRKLMEMQENYNKEKMVISTNLKTMILELWIEHTNTTDYRTFVLHEQSNQ